MASIAIIDYGMGNLRSVQKAIERVGSEAIITSDPAQIACADRVILPGVGAIQRGASCTYANSPDEDFIIDCLIDQPNVMVITGLSGHGFKFASDLGEIASDLAKGRASQFDLTPFRLSRFS